MAVSDTLANRTNIQSFRSIPTPTGNATPSLTTSADKPSSTSDAPSTSQIESSDHTVFSSWRRENQDKTYTLEQLKTNWLAEAERMVAQHYGLKGEGDHTLYVQFNDDPDASYLASVSYFTEQDDALSRATDQVLTLSTNAFPQGQNDNGGYKPFYGDRVVAHEMVHAIMGQTVDMDALPTWFKEGSAEFIHGADERLAYHLASQDGNLNNGYNEQDIDQFAADTDFFHQWQGSSEAYAKSYVAVRFLHQDIVEHGGNGVKDVMQFLTDEKMLATGNATLDNALAYLAYEGKTSYQSEAEFIEDFTQQAPTYIKNMNLNNDDTGAIGGADADGGEIKTAESVVDNTLKSAPNHPLKGYNQVIFSEPNIQAVA